MFKKLLHGKRKSALLNLTWSGLLCRVVWSVSQLLYLLQRAGHFKFFSPSFFVGLELTLEGRAHHIECPLLVGYSPDDRVMDPRGALKLYEKAVNSPQREMLAGVGHGEKRFDRRTFIADWLMKQLDAR